MLESVMNWKPKWKFAYPSSAFWLLPMKVFQLTSQPAAFRSVRLFWTFHRYIAETTLQSESRVPKQQVLESSWWPYCHFHQVRGNPFSCHFYETPVLQVNTALGLLWLFLVWSFSYIKDCSKSLVSQTFICVNCMKWKYSWHPTLLIR